MSRFYSTPYHGLVLLLLSTATTLRGIQGWVTPTRVSSPRGHGWHLSHSSLTAVLSDSASASTSTSPSTLSSLLEHDNHDQYDDSTAVRAPLKFVGPYPTLALRFPHLATLSQQSRNQTGVSLDFVLDTAANINTLHPQVASELQLKAVGEALPGVSASGLINGGTTYMLGDSQLDGIQDGSNFTFMTDLTASVVGVSNPGAAGLLSLAFFHAFDGVEFQWSSQQHAESGAELPPAVTFYPHVPESILQTKQRVAIEPIPITQLPSVIINVNGVQLPALLDTGSPVTVFNAQAAKMAKIETTVPDPAANDKNKLNPLAAMANRVQQAQAAARGDLLQVFGASGPVYLLKSTVPASIALPTSNSDMVEFAPTSVYVGDLPGLAALNGIGVDSPPAVVLGMDVLKQRPNMLLRAQQNEIWF